MLSLQCELSSFFPIDISLCKLIKTMKNINLIQIFILILGFQNCCTAADVNDRRCRLPEFPPNGRYKVTSTSSNYKYAPHSYVNESTTLDVECNPGSRRNTISYSICSRSTWLPPLPTCFKTCPALRSIPTTTFTCSLKNVDLDNCESPIEGTTAVIKCAEFYEAPGLQFSLPPECRNGKWDYNIIYCQPICGVKHLEAVPNLIGADDARIGSYPWQVAVYNEHKEQICGGAILSTHIVLSAAHCFSKPVNGDMLPKENYILASGKYFRAFQHPGDDLAQYSGIKDIKFPVRYKGSTNRYEHDIAIVFLVTPFTLSVAVQPVCVDLTNSHEDEELITSNKGVVSGWGETEEGRNPSETLKELEIPFIDYNLCYKKVPENFKTFITYDKICGGYLEEGKSVCRGDSGGAFSFEYKKDSRYYVRGIISLSPINNESQCDSNQYSVFTKVSKFNDMIVSSLRDSKYLLSYCGAETFRCASGECIPKRSECDGIIDCQDKSDETETCKNKPCDNTYFFRCNYGACINKNATCDGKLDCRDNSDEDSAECSISTSPESNQCRLPEFPLNGKYYALRGIMEYKSGAYVDEATLLFIKCDPGYKKETGTESYIVCLNGVWNHEPLKCVSMTPTVLRPGDKSKQKCREYAKFAVDSGVLPPNIDDYDWSVDNCPIPATTTISGRTISNPKEFPHMALVGYNDDNTQKIKWRCAGSLISERFILTSVQCSNSTYFGEPKYILLGDLDVENDTDDARPQQLGISRFISHPNYTEYSYYHDIALIEMERNVILSPYVRPACLNSNGTIYNGNALISGWGRTVYLGDRSTTLSYALIDIFSLNECTGVYRDYTFTPNGIQDNIQVCAGSHDTNDITCLVDVGGPLQLSNKDEVDCTYTITGVCSFGKLCGFAAVPEVYTKVSPYIEWIESHVWP